MSGWHANLISLQQRDCVLFFHDAAKALTPLVCDTSCDRSVQGTLNLMKRELDHLLGYDNIAIPDLSAYRTGAWLADSPYNIRLCLADKGNAGFIG